MDHVLATDDRRFWVAERQDEGRIVGFGSATMRADVWFLALLFVLPDEQGLGLGRELLARTLAGTSPLTIRATVTDSAQPISNAMYARIGIVPRVPVLHLLGPADDLLPLPALPADVTARPMNDAGPPAIDALGVIDREVLGYERAPDHAFFWRDGRRGFAYEDPAGRTIGYGYAAPSGRIGPIAALDETHVPAFVGHLLDEVPPADAASIWVAGSAGSTVAELLRAGFRMDGFPALLAWDRPFGSFERYVPATLALL